MEENELSNVYTKLKNGINISTAEHELVLTKLTNSNDEEDLYLAIRCFGLLNSPTYENLKLIERFLYSESDLILSSAVAVLCLDYYWDLMDNYIDKLLKVLNKEYAYKYSDTQIILFSSLGEYILKHNKNEILKFIYEIFIKELEEYENDQDLFYQDRLENIYRCLEDSIYGEDPDKYFYSKEMQFPKDVDKNLLDKIKIKIYNKNK